MYQTKPSPENSTSSSTVSATATHTNGSILASFRAISKLTGIDELSAPRSDPLTQVVLCKRLAKMPRIFLAKRRQLRKLSMESSIDTYTDDNAGLMAASPSLLRSFISDRQPQTFDEYTQKLEEALTVLRNMKREEYESEAALRVLRFLQDLIYQPKEWVSGAKLKLSEMKFPELAMTLMHSYKEKGYLVRHIVFMHSLLIYNAMSNFTDHEFDKEGLIRLQAADAGFIEFVCAILDDPSYRESLKKCYVIENPDDMITNDDFNNYQKILYICDAALTILYNMANLPELKIHFRECNATNVIAEYTNLPPNAIRIKFSETTSTEDDVTRLKELQNIARATRVTSCLLLPLIMNEDEDNLLATNTSDVLPLLSGMIKMYNQDDQRLYGFSFIELVDGLSKLMVRGRTHKYFDQNLLDTLLSILKNTNQEDCLLECVSNAILNASFDKKVQTFLDSENALDIITKARDNSKSQLVQKNCQAILWRLNRISQQHSIATTPNTSGLQGHIMISYNRSVTAMCLKIRDRLKALQYSVWLDVDNINGGVLESIAEAVEKSSIVLICMNEQYKQSHYCRLEAEYATELRKPCIPCLMQPRFRPYGWLGIIKGAKIHVDFATLPFDEAFSILIREIETIKRDGNSDTTADEKDTSKNEEAPKKKLQRLQSIGFSTDDTSDSRIEPKSTTNMTTTSNNENPIKDWSTTAVIEWLKRIGLSNLERALHNIDGKLLVRLYQMKQLAPDAYYKFLDKYFDRVHLLHMSDLLKFDNELENLLD